MVDIESGTTVDQQKDNEQNQELSSQEIMTLKSQLEETQQEAKNLKVCGKKKIKTNFISWLDTSGC